MAQSDLPRFPHTAPTRSNSGASLTPTINSTVGTREHYGWMDMLRGAAVMLVVLRHIPTTVAIFGGTLVPWIMTFSAALTPYRVPLLFLLSGMLLAHSLSKGLPRYYEGKAQALLWPYIVWVTITVLTLASASRLLNPMTWLAGIHHTWFLAVLLACYVMGPVVLKVPAWVLPIPMFVLAGFSEVPSLRRVLFHGAIFFAGAAVAPYVKRWQSIRFPYPVVMLAIAAVWGCWSAAHPGDGDLHHLSDIVLGAIGIAGLLWVAPRIPRITWLEWVGRHSIVIYLAHFPLIGLAWFALRPFDPSWWVLLPVMIAVGILLPIAMIPLSKTLLFRWPDRRTDSAPKPAVTPPPDASAHEIPCNREW